MRTQPDTRDCGLQLLRLALARHRVLPNALDQETFEVLHDRAREAREIERRALGRVEEEVDETAMARHDLEFEESLEPYSRFEALDAVGLDEAALRAALARELIFDRLARRASAEIEPVTPSDIARHYREHAARFEVPERREARQILITVNEVIAENCHEAVLDRIETLLQELIDNPERFPDLATAHSECPSALREGLLGVVSRGQLYPQLDRALFDLDEGAVSGVLESPLGFHLLRCERILPPSRLVLETVAPHIQREITAERQRKARQAWLAGLEPIDQVNDDATCMEPGYLLAPA